MDSPARPHATLKVPNAPKKRTGRPKNRHVAGQLRPACRQLNINQVLEILKEYKQCYEDAKLIVHFIDKAKTDKSIQKI
jgi:hypothetical protein